MGYKVKILLAALDQVIVIAERLLPHAAALVTLKRFYQVIKAGEKFKVEALKVALLSLLSFSSYLTPLGPVINLAVYIIDFFFF